MSLVLFGNGENLDSLIVILIKCATAVFLEFPLKVDIIDYQKGMLP